MSNIKHIVVAANPFGFGPTANAIPILEELVRRFSKRTDIRVYFVGSDGCQRIVPVFQGAEKVFLNERDEDELKKFLQDLDGMVVAIGVQNRFIVAAGNAVGCKTIFLDVLAWMWSEIPKTHLVANEIFWMRFPGILEKHHQYGGVASHIHIIEGVYKKVSYRGNKKGKQKNILLCIGGGFNPLRSGIQENYLFLIFTVLRMSRISQSNIDIISGDAAADFLRQCNSRPVTWSISTLNHDDTLEKLSSTGYFLSVGGQTSTMEAILSGIPTIFFVPSNLSQALLQIKMASEIKRENILWWKEGLSDLLEDIEYASEKDFIDRMEVISGKILSDNKKMTVFVSQFESTFKVLSEDSSYFAGLENIGRWIGLGGAKQIVDSIEPWLL